MNIMEVELDFEILVKGVLYVEDNMRWTSDTRQLFTRSFMLDNIEATFLSAIEKESFDPRQIDQPIVHINSKYNRARPGNLLLDGFSIAQCDRVLCMIEREWTYLQPITVDIELKVDTAKGLAVLATKASHNKRTEQEVISSPPTPSTQRPARRTRNIQLEQQAVIRQEEKKVTGIMYHQINNRWQCKDENCLNYQNLCWIFMDTKHHKIYKPHHLEWGKRAIPEGMARRFRTELRAYKIEYRALQRRDIQRHTYSESVAAQLTALRYGGGCILRSS